MVGFSPSGSRFLKSQGSQAPSSSRISASLSGYMPPWQPVHQNMGSNGSPADAGAWTGRIRVGRLAGRASIAGAARGAA